MGLPLGGQSLSRKGGDRMVTYAELFQYSLVVIGIVTLCAALMRKK